MPLNNEQPPRASDSLNTTDYARKLDKHDTDLISNEFPIEAGVLGLPEDMVFLAETDDVARITKRSRSAAGD